MDYKNTLMWQEICSTPAILGGIMQKNENTVKEIAREVKEKNIRNITGAARGTSDHALVYFKYLTETFSDIKVGLAACSITTMYDGCVNYGDNLVIGVSQSGRAVDVLEVLKRANSQGAVTLAITNNCESAMAKEAKYHLYCAAGEEKSVAATKTFSSQCFLLLWLALELAAKKDYLQQLPMLFARLESKIPMISEKAGQLADSIYNIKDGFVLSRGISYALALETTLKLQETGYILMKGYAESDFQHGPMAMVGKDTPVIMFAPKIGFVSEALENKHFDSFKATAEMLKGFGGNVFIVTNNDKFQGDNIVYFKDDDDEMFSFFTFSLFAQMLACKIAVKKGNNPDSPRALHKVTITV